MKKLILLLALIAIGCNAPVTEGHGFWSGGEGDEVRGGGAGQGGHGYDHDNDHDHGRGGGRG